METAVTLVALSILTGIYLKPEKSDLHTSLFHDRVSRSLICYRTGCRSIQGSEI